jgi:hypothetical protein
MQMSADGSHRRRRALTFFYTLFFSRSGCKARASHLRHQRKALGLSLAARAPAGQPRTLDQQSQERYGVQQLSTQSALLLLLPPLRGLCRAQLLRQLHPQMVPGSDGARVRWCQGQMVPGSVCGQARPVHPV